MVALQTVARLRQTWAKDPGQHPGWCMVSAQTPDCLNHPSSYSQEKNSDAARAGDIQETRTKDKKCWGWPLVGFLWPGPGPGPVTKPTMSLWVGLQDQGQPCSVLKVQCPQAVTRATLAFLETHSHASEPSLIARVLPHRQSPPLASACCSVSNNCFSKDRLLLDDIYKAS